MGYNYEGVQGHIFEIQEFLDTEISWMFQYKVPKPFQIVG